MNEDRCPGCDSITTCTNGYGVPNYACGSIGFSDGTEYSAKCLRNQLSTMTAERDELVADAELGELIRQAFSVEPVELLRVKLKGRWHYSASTTNAHCIADTPEAALRQMLAEAEPEESDEQ